MSRRPHPAAIGFLLLAALFIALGIWAQFQQNTLAMARAEAVATQGAAGFNAVPVPFLLQPFEGGWVPNFLYGPDGHGTVFGVMSKIGGAFGLLGLLFLSLRGRSVAEPDADAEDIIQVSAVPAVEMNSDWQRRLAQKMAYKPVPVKKQRAPSGLGRALYRAALVIVGLAFAGLASVMLIGSDMDLGAVDFAGLQGQITTTVRLALAGDQAAIISVATVAAVVLGTLIVLRVLIFRRKPAKRRNFATV